MKEHLHCRTLFLLLLTMVFLLCTGTGLYAETQSSAEQKIPRRVAFTLENNTALKEDSNVLDAGSRILYEAISARTPIVRVKDMSSAHNRIVIRFTEEGERVMVTGILYGIEIDGEAPSLQDEASTDEVGTVLHENTFAYNGNFENYKNNVLELATRMSEYLPMVSPEVRVITRVKEGKDKQVVEEVQFEEEILRPLEFTLYIGGLINELNFLNDAWEGLEDYLFFSLWPLQLDTVWYPGGDLGINVSLFADTLDMDFDNENEWILMPGLGIQYRIGGRFYGILGVSLFAGAYFSGDKPYFYSLLGLLPALGYNITPSFGITLRVSGLFVQPTTAFGGNTLIEKTVMVRHLLPMQIITLGLLFRPDL